MSSWERERAQRGMARAARVQQEMAVTDLITAAMHVGIEIVEGRDVACDSFEAKALVAAFNRWRVAHGNAPLSSKDRI